MKRTKNFMATALSLVLVLTLSTTAFAAPPAPLTQDNKSGNSTAWYNAGKDNTPDETDPTKHNMEGTYKVTIPEYIEAVAMHAETKPQPVQATEVLLLPDTKLDVTCDYSGQLSLTQQSTTKLAYKMQNNTVDFSTGNVVLTCVAGTPTQVFSTQIGAILTAAPLFAGNYSDTVVFTCAVNASK